LQRDHSATERQEFDLQVFSFQYSFCHLLALQNPHPRFPGKMLEATANTKTLPQLPLVAALDELFEKGADLMDEC
jgi:hypothetical protein